MVTYQDYTKIHGQKNIKYLFNCNSFFTTTCKYLSTFLMVLRGYMVLNSKTKSQPQNLQLKLTSTASSIHLMIQKQKEYLFVTLKWHLSEATANGNTMTCICIFGES